MWKTRPNQNGGFAKRMFRYFARLMEKFGLPIYPVAILSYNSPKRQEPDRCEVVFPNKTMLQFSFTVIQLNRLSWKDYIETLNPAAAALMTKMNIAPEDRDKVSSEITRMIRTLRLDSDKAYLIFGFMQTYLQTTDEEIKQYVLEAGEFPLKDKEEYMGTWTNYVRENRALGRQEGR